MSNLCVSCNSADSSIRRFLLRCDTCSSLWHHRCHKPPVSDPELIAIIARFNEEKKAGKLNPAFVWRCGSCSAPAAKLQAALPKRDIRQDSTPLPSSSNPAKPPEKHRSIAIDDDDDEIVIIENPPKQVSSTKQVKFSHKSSNASRDFRDPTAGTSSTSLFSTTAKKTVHKPQTSTKSTASAASVPARATKTVAVRPSGIRIIDDPFSGSIEPTPIPSQPPTRPPLRTHGSSSSSALVPGLLDLHMSTDRNTPVRMAGQDRNRRQDTLEYVTPPPPSSRRREPDVISRGHTIEYVTPPPLPLVRREHDVISRGHTIEYATPPPPPVVRRELDVISRGHTIEYVTPPPPPVVRREHDVISRGHTIEYATPPPPTSVSIRTTMGPPALPPSRMLGHPRIAQSLPPIAAIAEAPARRLLSSWIRKAHSSAYTVEPDIWQRSAVRRFNINVSASAASTGVTVSSGKFKAQNLRKSVGKEAKLSQAPFFFSSDLWLNAKKGVQSSYPKA
ncbi:hypothetical protein JR316_0002151 [Psilocybe cubensis]|uniref:PHD-type domain-containing protein n=2 Tax=Psilocybe cubensis TaxID=181762 RepID=A0A8H7Y2R4_PSICU|nr:hypothetical protein JR316_0002151 [Psilocybe cubensis]KAH9485244.1 hypothetical protein JR316_0002151 [Psilocybe cubensis]